MISALLILVPKSGQTTGRNKRGRELEILVGSGDILLGMLMLLLHCLYSFRGCSQASGMRFINPPEGKRRRWKGR